MVQNVLDALQNEHERLRIVFNRALAEINSLVEMGKVDDIDRGSLATSTTKAFVRAAAGLGIPLFLHLYREALTETLARAERRKLRGG